MQEQGRVTTGTSILMVLPASDLGQGLSSLLGCDLPVARGLEKALQMLADGNYGALLVYQGRGEQIAPALMAQLAALAVHLPVYWVTEAEPASAEPGKEALPAFKVGSNGGAARADPELYEQLLRAERASTLSNITHGIAYHLTNTLRPIQTAAVELLTRADGVESSALADVVERCQQAERLISRLQELSATSVGDELELVDINTLLERLVEATTPWWREELGRDGRMISVRLVLGPSRPLLADANALREAFLQLLTNAVEAIPQSGQVELRSESIGGSIRVMITDNGVGVPQEFRKRIFQPFVTTKGPQRIGLGLSMVQSVVGNHRGTVDVFSQEGAGTTAMVTLPYPDSETSGVGQGERRLQQDKAGLSSLPAQHVLVVAADESIRDLISKALVRAGQEVAAYASSEEGMTAFYRKRHAVVFTDWGIEGTSGLQMAQRIKQAAPSSRVILVTGLGAQIDAKQSARWSVDAVLTRPFTEEQVIHHLASVMGR